MKLDAQAFLKADKNKTKIKDYPERSKVRKLVTVNEAFITKDDGDRKIRIASGISKYVDKSTGEIREVNKTLIDQSDGQVAATKNSFGVHIQKTLDSQKGILFDDGFHKVTMLPVLQSGKESIGELDAKHPNKILFKNFIEKDNLEYVVQENGLKENIIISCKRDNYSYKFKVILENLEAVNSDNDIHFLDVETRKEIFVMNNIFMFDQAGERSKSIEMRLDENKENSYDLTIVPNSKWINSNKRRLPVTIDPQIQVVDTPILSLQGYKSGYSSPAVNNKLVLGVKNGYEYKVNLSLDSESIVSELVRNNIQKFNVTVELHYLVGKRLISSKGFVIYNNSTKIMKDLLNNEKNILSIDITSLVETEMIKYLAGRPLSKINLQLSYADTHSSILSDGRISGIKVRDDYVYLIDRYYDEKTMRPEIQLDYIKKDHVVEGTPFLEYKMGKSGNTSINIFNKNISHVLSLGSIKENSLNIDVGLLFDDRLLREMKQANNAGPFGKGWMLNVCQRLIKNNDYSKLLGSKDVTYIDGNNNPHTLYEKWYYEENDVRHYIPKDLVYIDNDQKMKYLNEKTSKVYEVEYEVSNEDGLTLITTNGKMNYVKQTDKKLNRRYFIFLKNNKKLEVFMNSNGVLSIPRFYVKGKNGIKADAVPNFLSYLKELDNFSLDQLRYTEYIDPSVVIKLGNKYFDSKNNELIKYNECCNLYYRDGRYYVKLLRHEYYLSDDYSVSFSDYKSDSYDIPIIIEKEYYVDKSEPLVDYFENENIVKINSQIQQIEDYIDEIKLQSTGYSNAVRRLQEEISHQKVMRDRNLKLNDVRDAATAKNEEVYPPTIFKIENNQQVEDTPKTIASTQYRLLIKKQTELSDEYQDESYKYQLESLKSQLEDQQKTLDNYYKKLSDYETQLTNLKAQKAALVDEQKKTVQDYVIDKSGNILGFNYYGNLVQIEDSHENKIMLKYDENKLIEISGNTQKMCFNYDKYDHISSIVDAQGRRKECSYEKGILSKVRFIAENNKKQDILFHYSSDEKLYKIIDPSGMSLQINQEDNNFRIIQATATKSISTAEVQSLKEAKKIVDVSLQVYENENCSTVVDSLNEIETSYYYDDSGRLLNTFVKDLDTNKCTSTFIHFENKNKQFEISFDEDKKFKSFYLGNEINKKFTAVLNLTDDKTLSKMHTTLNPSCLENCKLAFARLDLRNLSQCKWLSLNLITLKAVVTDKDGNRRNYVSNFSNISRQVIGIPFALKSTDKEVRVSIIARKSIDLSKIRTMDFFESEGTISTYNSDNQLIKIEDGESIINYEGFVDDKATRVITLDKFGVKRTAYASYDANGRVVYREDPLRNCKETFYDEKGKVVETREYNKESPTLAKVFKTKYDEQGNATKIDGVMRDESGNYPQEEIRCLPNSSKIISTKSATGQVMNFGFDYNTGDLLEISSETQGQGNSTRMKYRFGLLTSLTHHDFTVDYTLDGQGRKIGIAVAGKTLLTNEYTDQYSDDQVIRGSKVTTKMINGFESTTIKDKEGKLVSTITNDDRISYVYDKDNQLVEVKNLTSDEKIQTEYNKKGLVVKNTTEKNGIIVAVESVYDKNDLVTSTTKMLGDISTISKFKYDKIHENRLYETLVDDNLRQSVEYDALSRVTKKTLSSEDSVLIEDEFEYLQYGENSLDLIKEHNVKVGGKLLDTVSYTYDVAGNITNVLRDEFKTRYTYDKLNRLVREDNPRLNQTTVYKYDNGGNILLKKTYPYTLDQEVFGGELCHYTYSSENWKDQLVDFNGQSITYDEMGRPTQIGNATLSWNLKGQLISFGNVEFAYNLNGIRTSKIVNSIQTDYYLSLGKILREKSNEKDIIYHYAMEKLIGFTYKDILYIYERNIQGDILGIYKKDDLTKVAEYVYDAYGNHNVINYTEENIGDINPIRYRGYYYDQETKLYYLNSRYYSPEFGRFISPDTLSILDETKAQINGLNLYMYCGDNPIMRMDPSGMNWWDDFCKTVSDGWNNVCNAVSGATKTVVDAVSSGVETISNWASNTFGFSVSTKKEVENPPLYCWFATITSGGGYSKAFSNGKPVNFAVTLPTKWYRFWEFSVGLDININGYGGSLGIGTEASIGVHAGKHNFDISGNALGRLGFQYTIQEENGLYAFTKFTLNLPETALTAVVAYYGVLAIGSLGSVFAPATIAIIAILNIFK